MKSSAQVLADNPTLKPYRVTLKENEWDKFTLVFDCYAEDQDHAEEQALDANPDYIVYNITLFPDME